MQIAFIMGHLRLGGAERVVSVLCEQMVERNDEITLINLSHERTNFFNLPEKVKQISLDMDREANTKLDTLSNVFNRFRVLRQAIKQVDPDVLLSFTDRTNILALLANLRLSYPMIVSIRVYPAENGIALQTASRLLYPMADAVVSVSTGTDMQYLYIDPNRRFVIGNPVHERFQQLEITSHTTKPVNRIISLGRFIKRKGHHLLITAFANISQKFTDWELHIYGDGPEHDTLEKLITSYGLSDRIVLHAPVRDVLPILQTADIYVQPSDFEGFSNAVLEAMACNLPVIVTDYAGDPRDCITHDKTGLIVPVGDEDALCNALRSLMSDPEKRRELGQAAGYVRQTFSVQNITQQWYNVINSVVDKR